MLSEVVTLAAALIARIGLQASGVTAPESSLVESVLLAIFGYAIVSIGMRIERVRRETLARGGWWGWDAYLLELLTVLALSFGVALAVWAVNRAEVGEKLGGHGAILVLMTVSLVAAKLVIETTLYARLGGEPSPRQEYARRLIGPLSGWAKLRYALGVFGGIILPLAAQLLAGGAKNIPPTVAAGPSAVMAVLAIAFLSPGELLERRLFWRAQFGHEKAREAQEAA
jgi:hypothetical protein